MYLTTRLDDAEVSLTHAETKLTQDDKGYVDLESAKKQLDISKVGPLVKCHHNPCLMFENRVQAHIARFGSRELYFRLHVGSG